MKHNEKKPSPEESGSKGGKATLEKHGKSHFSKIAKRRWRNKKKQRAS